MSKCTFGKRNSSSCHLSPCPSSPNCVSTDAKRASQKIEPLPYIEDAFKEICFFFKKNYSTKVKKKTQGYLHLVVSTKIFRFKDDVEFLISPEKKYISVRSAARVGFYDFGKNRQRIESLRKFLQNEAKFD